MDKPIAILFDFGDTLLCDLKFDPIAGNARLLEFAEASGVTRAEDIQEVADALHSEISRLRNSGLVEFPVQSFQRILYDKVGLTFSISPAAMELEFWKSVVSYAPEPGIGEALTTLKSHGLKMAVVSNNAFSGPVLEWELEQHNLLKAFAFVLSSADYGIRKPHPLIFSTAVSKLGVLPSEVWFCGDMLQFDVAGAKEAGLWAIWYNRQNKNGDDTAPHAEVSSWSEFLHLIQRHLS